MSTNQNRIHDQIVDLITKAHTSSDTMEAKIQCLQEATELLLYHTAGNERLDEFLETFLSMHISREAPIRRFCAHFIEALCFTRSRYACSCLEVLVTLLQDSDKQVLIFALRAARVAYKRALYWISVQQREPMFVTAARESVETLDHVLARIVHLITSSTREVFCESIRCAQSIVLNQSFSSFAAKSQAQLEAVGCSCLEDLKLVDTAALDESKLKGQSDRLFTALCALLVKKRDDGANAFEMEVIALIHAVGVIGHDRGSYAGAATLAFTQLVDDIKGAEVTGRIKAALVTGLKRILASRHCVQWQPRIIPVLARLGVAGLGGSDQKSTDIVMQAEIDRMRQQVEAESGNMAVKRRKLAATSEQEGERLMMISELADWFKVPDEDHAVAVCAVRAQSPAELAKLALAVLGRLPKKFDDPLMALVKVNRAGGTGQSLSFDNRVKAIRTMGLKVSDFTNGDMVGEDEMMEERKSPEKKTGDENSHTRGALGESGNGVDVTDLIDVSQVALFMKLIAVLRMPEAEKLALVDRFCIHHLGGSNGVAPIVQLVTHVYTTSLFTDIDTDGSGISVEDVGRSLVSAAEQKNIPFSDFKTLILALPTVPTSLLEFVDARIQDVDVAVRRNALTTLSALLFSHPGIANDSLDRLVAHCASTNEAVRNDALKLVLAKVYSPQASSCLTWQWPYTDPSPVTVKKSIQGDVSQMQYLGSEKLECIARDQLVAAATSGEWDKAWLMLALCSKKILLIHSVLATLIEVGEVSLPAAVVTSFGQSLVALPADAIDHELETLVKHYKAVRAVAKKKMRNDFLLPILSAISSTDRGLTGSLADAALSFSK